MNNILIALALVGMAYAAPQDFNFHSNPNTLAIPVVLPDGHLDDTPEVKAATIAHFGEVARADAASRSFNQFSDAPSFVPADPSPFVTQPSFATPASSFQSLSNPAAGIVVNDQGFLLDTADVARATAIHYAALARAVGAPTDQYTRYLASLN